MKQPNIVLIMTDTQSHELINGYSNRGLNTPNLDQLIKDGVRFDRAYTTCPVCTPARAGIFTGSYPHQAGAWSNHQPLGNTIKNMGQRFSDNGYNTAYTGKWHLDGHDYHGTGICPEGWNPDYWYDGKNHLDYLGEEKGLLWRSKLRNADDLREHAITPEFTWGHQVSNRAIDFLDKQKNQTQPFLLVVSYDEPHGPYTCPASYVDKYKNYEYDIGPAAYDTLEGKPNHHKEWASTLKDKQLHKNGKVKNDVYFGCNEFIDDEIGRVITQIDENQLDNTIIIYTSDHGTMMGAHGITQKGPLMYEEIVHIPLIVRLANKQQAGTTSNNLVSHIDLLPTMLDFANIDPCPFLDGKSIRRKIENPKEHSEDPVFIEFNRFESDHDSVGGLQPIRCIIHKNHKLAINLLSDMDELYDLDIDPHELNNLINNESYSEIRDTLHKQVLDWMNNVRDPFRGPCWERRSWASSNYLSWNGKIRPKPDDGYAPPMRKYATGEIVKADEREFANG